MSRTLFGMKPSTVGYIAGAMVVGGAMLLILAGTIDDEKTSDAINARVDANLARAELAELARKLPKVKGR